MRTTSRPRATWARTAAGPRPSPSRRVVARHVRRCGSSARSSWRAGRSCPGNGCSPSTPRRSRMVRGRASSSTSGQVTGRARAATSVLDQHGGCGERDDHHPLPDRGPRDGLVHPAAPRRRHRHAGPARTSLRGGSPVPASAPDRRGPGHGRRADAGGRGPSRRALVVLFGGASAREVYPSICCPMRSSMWSRPTMARWAITGW